MDKKKYKIIESRDPKSLESLVNEAMQKGW